MKINLNNLLEGVGDVALRRRARWLMQNMHLEEEDKILDMGCGDGFYLYLLSKLNLKFELTGVDINERALESAKVHLKGKRIRLIQADILNLPFPEASFDKIIASEVLEHVGDDVLALKELHRVLKKGGILVLSVPHKNYPFFWDPINWTLEHLLDIHIQSGFWAGIWNQHLRLYSEKDLQDLLRRCFTKNSVSRLTHYCLPFNHYIINIVAIILANKKMPSLFKKLFSKYEMNKQNQSGSSTTQGNNFNPFAPIFFFDRLNDNWNKKGSAVSLVAVGVK